MYSPTAPRRYERLFAVLALASALACMGGCTGTDTEDASIRFGIPSAPVTLDPRFATDAVSYRLCRLIYQSLVDFDDEFRPVPALARWRQITPVHYRFELKPDQSFHDGRRVTAGDVVATYRSVLDAAMGSPHRGSLINVAAIKQRSDLVVDFHLKNPDPLFPGLLVIGIVPGGSTTPAANPIGSGPFRIDAVASDKRVRMVRRRDGLVVDFVVVKNATVRALKLANGDLDVIQGSISPELVGWLADRGGVEVQRRSGTTFTYVGFNLADAVTGEAAIRRAIALAIDRRAIVKHLFNDGAKLASAILTPSHWAGHPSLDAIDFDPEQAAAIIEGLGYSAEHPLPLVYKTSSDHFRQRLATVIQDQLRRVGIAVEIQSFDWGTFYADIKAGRFQMYTLSWVGLKLPDIFRYAFHSDSVPPEGANRGRYAGAVVDALIEQAEASTSLSERAAAYRQLQATLLADLPYVPLWYEDHIVVTRRAVQGYRTDSDGSYDRLVDVIKLAAR